MWVVVGRTPESEAAEKGMGRGEVGGKSECEPQGRGEGFSLSEELGEDHCGWSEGRNVKTVSWVTMPGAAHANP